jgi:hypothetical protein
MPAIDLARLRKQATRLADFFFLPDEFLKHLREILDFYVNYTIRKQENVAPGSNLKTYRTPRAVLTHIENELKVLAENNPHFALELADGLWDEGALETRLLAAFLLGRIPPQEERLIARLTAWTQQVRDPEVRAALLSTSLSRMRKEAPGQFLELIREYLHPARTRTWSNGIQALLPMIADTGLENFPPILDLVEPVIESAPSTLQTDLAELIVALYRASPTETIYLLKQILSTTQNPMTAITLRRISPTFPPQLQEEVREYLRARPLPVPAREEKRWQEVSKSEAAADSRDTLVETQKIASGTRKTGVRPKHHKSIKTKLARIGKNQPVEKIKTHDEVKTKTGADRKSRSKTKSKETKKPQPKNKPKKKKKT